MAETRPLKGASPFAEAVLIDDVVIEEIQEKVSIEMDGHGLSELKGICQRFIANTKMYSKDNWPRRSNIKAALKRLLFKGKSDGPLPELLNTLKEMDFATRSMLATEQSWVKIDRLIDHLVILNSAANDCLSSIEKDKGGPSSDKARIILINDLMGFYEKHTGDPAVVLHDREPDRYYGAFFKLISVCLDCLGHPPQSSNALGKAIIREQDKINISL